jgi:hypothetical protein
MSLRSDVTDYLFSRLDDLPTEKQFHVGNRLAAWQGDARAVAILQQHRSQMIPQPLNEETLVTAFTRYSEFQPSPTISGYTMRQQYFATYPRLTGIHACLLYLRHLRTVYDIDARTAFAKVVPTQELVDLEAALLADPQAMRLLSTYAINTLYLFHLIVLEDNNLDVQFLYSLGEHGYDTAEPEQLRLLIYLYTHCIIAASNFYTRELPDKNLAIYRAMLQTLEEYIDHSFEHVSLDTKVEFWVCCRVAHYATRLAARIDAECSSSVSPEGTFIIDTHNDFAMLQAKSSFEDSEHRNTLFILSGSEFHPHSIQA